MATAAAKPKADLDAAAPAGKGKKKLILALVLALVLAGAGGGFVVWKQKKAAAAAEAAAAAAEEEGDENTDEEGSTAKSAKASHHSVPIFVPLDPFVVNLADKGTDRYAQIAVTFEIEDAKFADQLKLYMPAIRSNILLILAHKTADELLERTGKEALANEIMKEALRPLGLEAEDPPHEGEKNKSKRKGKAKTPSPITKVHFANFIIQ